MARPCYLTWICSNGAILSQAVPLGTVCGGTDVCDGGGECVECNGASDCPLASVCQHATCDNHICGVANDPAGTVAPANQQVSGDCKKKVCDGGGGVTEQNDDGDPQFDPYECTQDVCNAGSPTHPPQPSGTACSQGYCDGAGQCVECTLSSHCSNGTCVNYVCSGTSWGPR